MKKEIEVKSFHIKQEVIPETDDELEFRKSEKRRIASLMTEKRKYIDEIDSILKSTTDAQEKHFYQRQKKVAEENIQDYITEYSTYE